jgi:glyoxylase I family protein
MANITGIGGIFINIDKNSQDLLDWYAEVLGVTTSQYGISFLTPNVFTLITFEQKEGPTRLNFTVDNIEEFMAEMKKKDVEIVSEIKEYSYGKFAQIKDCNGGIVELWEPFEEAYLKMAKKEVEDHENSRKI